MNASLLQGVCSRSCALLVAALLSLSATTSLATAAEAMLTGSPTRPPIGHFEFCKLHVTECTIRSRDTGPEHMTNKLWQLIGAVNLSVNKSVKPVNDFDHYGKDEVWSYPDDGYGDCEDFALEKRRILLNSGVPVSDLLITVARKPDGEGHAVLTVRTDAGDFVLDSLNPTVLRWDQTGYRYVKRQASDYTGHWISIVDNKDTLVGALD